MPEKVPFAKPALPVEEQVALLEARGLVVADKSYAKRVLESISYYRFSGYTRYYSSPEDPKRQIFRADVTLDDVVNLWRSPLMRTWVVSKGNERRDTFLLGDPRLFP